MDMQVRSITSDSLIPIEEHFRVFAGPGAGKTYWIVKHIKNVLANSKRLMKTRKIACITYTNISVETILKRLGTSSDRVEVSTIHSFLYGHILKPYAPFLAGSYGLNVVELSGHEDSILHLKKVIEWVENHPSANKLKHPYTVNQLTKLEIKRSALIAWLSSLRYELANDNNLKITGDRAKAYCEEKENEQIVRKYLNARCLDVLETDLLGYKRLYWKEGFIDHNDVLFFAYQLIKEFPFVLTVLRAKFPYFFVDEFQDTHPIQAAILKLIGQKETVIGVIGDQAQSIYGFQGADPEKFRSFELPGMKNYEIPDNRRSTNQIIELLNSVRLDMRQSGLRNVDREKPTIIIGERVAALRKAITESNNESVYSLSRKNITSNVMKRQIGDASFEDGVIEELLDIDKSNAGTHYRSGVIIGCAKATELAREGKFKDAIKELVGVFKDTNDKNARRKQALKYLCLLLNKYDLFKDKSLFDFYLFVKNSIKPDISMLRSGAPKTYYMSHTYLQLALCVKINDDISKHKTIHKAKGDEFDNVLIVLDSERDLEAVVSPNLSANEEHRIYYVAMSRAMDKLYINIPSLPDDVLPGLTSLFNIEQV